MEPVTSLEEAIYYFDPVQPLSGEEMSFYVDRRSDARSAMLTVLRANDLKRQRPVKLLFTGHKGSGKSTEINKLCEELGDQFFVVKVSFRMRPDVNYVDILVKAAMSLFKSASDQEIIKRAPAQIAGGLWEKISGFVEKKIFGDIPIRKELLTGKEVTTKVNLLGLEFESKFESETESREQIRRLTETHLSEIISNIDDLADSVRINYGRPVLFVFEDTDKIDLNAAKDLFYGHGPTLTEFQASAIYLMPIGLRYSPQFATIKQYFNEHHHCLPNIRLTRADGVSDEQGARLLEQIITRRMERSLVSEEALTGIIEASGGLVRTLVALVRDAAVTAIGRGAHRIELRDVQRAIGRIRRDFIAMLREEHYPVLKARHQDKHLTADQVIQDLLESLALLEYGMDDERRDYSPTDDSWCDVHPIVLPVVEERTK